MTSRSIVAAARKYIGTPFAHQGRSAYGLDCLGLLVCVARDLGLAEAAAQDVLDYAHYPDVARLQAGLKQVLRPVRALRPGRVVLMEIDGHARHLGVLGDYSHGHSLIHAYAPARKVVEHRLDASWQARIVKVYALSS